MKRTYKLIASRGDDIVFDDRVHADTPRHARREMKKLLGLESLSGIVYSITEIPVDLIREIVAEILAGGVTPAANIVPITRPEPDPTVTRFDAFADAAEPEVTPTTPAAKPSKAKTKTKIKVAAPEAKVGNPGHGDELWSQVRAHWEECRSISQTAEKFGLSPNTVKTRARRENWKQGVTA